MGYISNLRFDSSNPYIDINDTGPNAEAKNWQRAMRTATSLEPECAGFDES
jgi:hypothetical protein